MNPELVNLLQVLASILCFALVGVIIGYLFHARRAVRAASYENDQLHKLLDRQEQAYTAQSERLRQANLRITRLQVSDGIPVMSQSFKNELTDQIDKRRAEAEVRLKKAQEFAANAAQERRRHADQSSTTEDGGPLYNQLGFLYGVAITQNKAPDFEPNTTTERGGTFDGAGASGDWDRSSSSSSNSDSSSSPSSSSDSSSSSSDSGSSSSSDSGSSSSGGCD